MAATAERLFDSFVVVGLTSLTSPPPTAGSLSSTFSAVNQSGSSAEVKIVPFENGFEFDSISSSSPAAVDITSSILYRYPADDPSSINPKSLCDFCFPDLGSFRSKKVAKKWKIKRETFSFVLTDTKGGKRWGYCYRRLSPVTSMPVCFCLLSFLPCFGFFSQLVQKLSSIEERTKGDFEKYRPLLEEVYSRPIPAPGDVLTVPLPSTLTEPVELVKERKKKDVFLPEDQLFDPELQEWTFARPEDNDWMLDDINILPLIRFLSPSNILAVFTSLLVERRIIFVADNLSTLSSCVQAAAALLYPFSWQHIFIPVLPQSLLSFACAPMPFVIGVLRGSVTELKKMSDSMEEIVVVDVDNNKFYAPPEMFDKRLLPSYLSDPLLHSLEIAFKEARQTLGPLNSYFNLRKKETEEKKQQKQKRIEEKLERDIRYDLGNAFVGFFIDLLGNYKNFVRSAQEGGIRDGNFDRRAFVDAQPEDVRPLLELIVQSQLFFMFIEDRKRKEAEEKRRGREGRAWGDWRRRGGERDQEREEKEERESEFAGSGGNRGRSSTLASSSGSCIASFSSSSSSSASSSPMSSYTAFPVLRSSASGMTHTRSSSLTSSSSSSVSSAHPSASASELKTRLASPQQPQSSSPALGEDGDDSDSGSGGSGGPYISGGARLQRKMWLQSRFSMYENGEISREDLAKRWKEIEKEERKMEKDKDKERKKVGQRKRRDEKKGEVGDTKDRSEMKKEDIVLLLDRFHLKKMSAERDRELDRKIMAEFDSSSSSSSSSSSHTANSDERAALRTGTVMSTTSGKSLPSSSSSSFSPSPSLPLSSGKRFNPILKVSAEKRTEASRSDSVSSPPFPSPPPPPPPHHHHHYLHQSRTALPSPSGALILHATKLSSSASSSSSLPRSKVIPVPPSPSPRVGVVASSPASSPSPSSSPSSSPRFNSPFSLVTPSSSSSSSSPSFSRPLPPVKLPSPTGPSGGVSSSQFRLISSFTSTSLPPSSSSSCTTTTNTSTQPPSLSSPSSVSSILSPRHRHLPSSSSSSSPSPSLSSAALASSASGSRPLPHPPLRRSISERPSSTPPSSSVIVIPSASSSSSSSAIPEPPPPPRVAPRRPPRSPAPRHHNGPTSSSSSPPSTLVALISSYPPPSSSSSPSCSSAPNRNLVAPNPPPITPLGSSVSHASVLPTSHPMMVTSSSSNADRFRSLTRTIKNDDSDVIDVSKEKEKRKEKEKKEKEKKENMLDKEWKEERNKEKRNKINEKEVDKKKMNKDERRAVKEKEKSEKKKQKELDKKRAMTTDSATRQRSHSDGAKEFDLVELKGSQNDKPAKVTRKALEHSSILHSGYLFRKMAGYKGKGDSYWERHFCVLSKRWLAFYARKDDAEPVLRVKLKEIKQATFYRNISSLMLFDRENCFELAMAEGSEPMAGIHAATPSLEEGRTWSGALQQALVPCRLG